ncbi:hypothetical protein LCGC14_2385530 [marine sediment metagenome]|uniref:Uncharacterized protein n=1 Tax=marine sediment metagenome TaxID=412755 RepID=A0A0F9CLU5_9ZZZZ
METKEEIEKDWMQKFDTACKTHRNEIKQARKGYIKVEDFMEKIMEMAEYSQSGKFAYVKIKHIKRVITELNKERKD